MSLDENKSLVRRLMDDDISQGDETVARAIIHSNFHDHTNPPGMRDGIDGHLAIVRLFRAAFPNSIWRIEDLIAEGDKVVARTVMTGTHLGEFFAIPATGRSVTMGGVHVLRIADGKIAEHWGSNDDLSLMGQLGVFPAVGAPA